jgi:hypothetical protein
VGVLLGNGSGGFAPVTTFAAGGSNPSSITTADFNGDHNLDLAVALSSGYLGIFLGNGFGGFSAPTTIDGGGSWQSYVRTGDLNGDGKLDLAVTNRNTGKVAILFGDGQGRFGAPIFVDCGGLPQFLYVGDVNGDSQADIVVTNSNGQMSVLPGAFSVSPVALASAGGQSFLVRSRDSTGSRWAARHTRPRCVHKTWPTAGEP